MLPPRPRVPRTDAPPPLITLWPSPRPSPLAQATAQEEEEPTPYTGNAPWDFMGLTLFTATPSDFDGGHGRHYDMLHNSPNGAGIAWEADNVYWVFDGNNKSLTRSNFNQNHDAGAGV